MSLVCSPVYHTHMKDSSIGLHLSRPSVFSLFLHGGSEGTTSGLALLPTQPFLENDTFRESRLFSQPVSTVNAISFIWWMILTQGRSTVSSWCPESKPAVIGNKSDCHSPSGSRVSQLVPDSGMEELHYLLLPCQAPNT